MGRFKPSGPCDAGITHNNGKFTRSTCRDKGTPVAINDGIQHTCVCQCDHSRHAFTPRCEEPTPQQLFLAAEALHDANRSVCDSPIRLPSKQIIGPFHDRRVYSPLVDTHRRVRR